MLASELDPVFNGLLALGMAIARLFPCLIITPIFAFSSLKGMVRGAIVVALSLFIAPSIVPVVSGLVLTPWNLVALALKEVVLGILLGYLLALPFWLFESVGALFDSQRGALNAGQLNPALGPDATPLGHMLLQWAMIVLVMTFGLSLITQVLWDSYQLWPVDNWLPGLGEQGFKQFLSQVQQLFMDMVLYGGPLILLLLLFDFAVGILSIYSPQLQASVLAIPLKCLAGLLFFILYLPALEYFAGHQFSAIHDLIPHLQHVFPARGTGK